MCDTMLKSNQQPVVDEPLDTISIHIPVSRAHRPCPEHSAYL